MKLTPAEKKLVRPYLAMKPQGGRAWVVGLAAGLLVCAFGLAVRWTDLWPAARAWFLIIFVVGLLLVEQGLDARRRHRLAGVLQKYDAALRRAQAPGEHEETV